MRTEEVEERLVFIGGLGRCGLLILSLCLLSVWSVRADFSSLVSPTSSDLSIIEGSSEYLSFKYYDWGPGWSGVRRKVSVVEKGEVAHFTFNNEIQKTQTAFEIEGSWRAVSANMLKFEATLKSSGHSALTMAQFGLNFGGSFGGGSVEVTQADGSTASHLLPLGRGTLGDGVRKMVLGDVEGQKTVIRFDPPAVIAMDGQARFIIAKDMIESGDTKVLAFTLALPAATQFFAGPEAAGGLGGQKGWYAFSPPDSVSSKSELSMADWLEVPAGLHGRIRRKGGRLMAGEKVIKLWGVNNCYGTCAPKHGLADKRADFYAAMGINAVRLHKYAQGSGWGGILKKETSTEFDPDGLERMDYLISAFKKRGIYTKLSPVFIVRLGAGDRERVPFMDELGPMNHGRINPKHGSFYLSTEVQDVLIAQMVNLLKHKNEHTGLRYAEDPAIAFVEIYNEDSALWHGVTGVLKRSPTLRARAGGMFAKWLKKKYGSEEAFMAAWGEGTLNCEVLGSQGVPLDESWAESRIYPVGNPWFYDPDNLNGSQSAFKVRLLDTMVFLYELQNWVYSRYTKAIRAAGYEGEFITSNWQAGRMMSHFYNLHSDAMFGTVDRHNYFGGGSAAGGLIASSSMLSHPGSGSLSSSLQAVAGHPFMFSEWIHVYPNEWGVEGPAILGAYGMGLQGWDVSFAFQNADEGGFNSAIGRTNWEAASPQFMGIFPAVSRQVHGGDVKESEVVHYRNVHIPSLQNQRVGFKEMVKHQGDVKTVTSDVFPAEALAVARGEVRFTKEFEPTESFDLSVYEEDGKLVSSTKQLRWVAGDSPQDGHIEINTPGTQAVVGFAKDEVVRLDDAIIILRSRYAAIYLSAQSRNRDLSRDRGVLLTAISRARNEGMVVVNDTYLMSRGEMRHHKPVGPVVMEPVVAEIVLKRGGSPAIYVLDHGGVKTGRRVPVRNGRFTVDTGRDKSPYYLIQY